MSVCLPYFFESADARDLGLMTLFTKFLHDITKTGSQSARKARTPKTRKSLECVFGGREEHNGITNGHMTKHVNGHANGHHRGKWKIESHRTNIIIDKILTSDH